MTHIVQAPCYIEGCNNYYDYNAHHDDMRALEVVWRQALPFEDREPKSIYLWGEQPKVNHCYAINIKGVVKIDIEKPFWAFYQDPIVWEEGLETQDGIQSLEFCLCEKVALKKIETKSIQLIVKVLKKISINQIKQLPTTYTLTADLNSAFLSDYARYDQIGHFTVIEINYQGDCGATYIVEKEENKHILRLENNWSFHESIWLVPNIEIHFPTQILNNLNMLNQEK